MIAVMAVIFLHSSGIVLAEEPQKETAAYQMRIGTVDSD